MTLPDRNGKPAIVRIQPLPVDKRPTKGADTQVEVTKPASRFPLREITWQTSFEYRSFADLLMAEARRLNQAGRDSEAFEYILFLHNNYGDYPGLKQVEDEFLYGETKRLFIGKEYDQALAVVEQLYARDPNYRESASSPPMSQVLTTTAKRYFDYLIETQHFSATRDLLDRLKIAYPDVMRDLAKTTRESLIKLAEREKATALAELEQNNSRPARAAVRRMLNIWPDIDGGSDVAKQVIEQKQIALVGVSNISESARWNDIADWAARRRSVLMTRRLFEFTGFGAEQGDYDFLAGTRELSEDGRRWTLRLSPDRPAAQAIGSSYALSSALRSVADPTHPDYNATWARLTAKVEVVGPDTVTVHLRQPHVLPQALLQVPLTKNLFPPRFDPNPAPTDTPTSDQASDGTIVVDEAAARAKLDVFQRLSPFAEVGRSLDEVHYLQTKNVDTGSGGTSKPPVGDAGHDHCAGHADGGRTCRSGNH